jgi:hypothetical protein
LRDQAAALLRAALQRPEVTSALQGFPDGVLSYLRQNFTLGTAALDATGHWIEAELARRANAFRVEALARPVRPRSAAPQPMPTRPLPQVEPVAPPAPAGGSPPLQPATAPSRPAPPPPPPPGAEDEAAEQAALTPVLGELALPGAAPKKGDSAILLWILLVALLVVAIAVVVGAVVYIRSLPVGAAVAGMFV